MVPVAEEYGHLADLTRVGLPAESSRPLNADHRHVCKYSSPRDANYIAVRDVLLSAIKDVEQKGMAVVSRSQPYGNDCRCI
jgi:hypothetical protein